MPIKVLHIFAPNYKHRFGGPIFNWKYYFSNWNNPDVEHFVLDFDTDEMKTSMEAFNFEISNAQKIPSRWERAVWFFKLLKNLDTYEEKYDILQVHVLWWATLLLGPWSRWKNIPSVYESVLLYEDTPGGIVHEHLGTLKIHCLKSYKAILAISEYLAEDYWKYDFSKNQVFQSTNCVDMELFTPLVSREEKIHLRQELDLPQNATILLFVGSVIKRKGVDILIDAFCKAVQEYPDLHLLIVGPKNKNENPSLDEGFVQHIYSIADQNSQLDKVSFMGLVQDQQQLAEIYRASDIFVFPSRNEGLPNVLLEAMACGLPVVVSQLPVLEKVIVQGENGLVIPVNDINSLKDALLRLVAEPSLARKIGKNAHHYIETNHNFLIWQAQLTNFYRSLLS